MSVADNIKRIRESHGMTQAEFGAIAGVTDKAVSTWESGKKEPRMGAVQKIADYFGISKSDILLDAQDLARMSWNAPASTGRGVKIPVLGDVAAGVPIEAMENIIDYEEIEPELAATGEFYGLRIKGDSMEPRMCEGDVVIVRRQNDVATGETAVVLVNGDSATVKRIKKLDDGSLLLIANNPSYDPRHFSPAEIRDLPVAIIGKVIELRGKF